MIPDVFEEKWHLGKSRCRHIYPNGVTRCVQSVYDDGTLCYFHKKRKEGRIGPPEKSDYGKLYQYWWARTKQ